MFPNLPTDNLYKFLFVGCLFLIGVVVYFFINIYGGLTTSYDTYKVESVKLDIEYNRLKLEYSKTERMIADENSDPDKTDMIIERLDSSVAAFHKNEAILNGKLKNVERNIGRLKCSLPYLVLVLIILFLGVIFFGWSWYNKLQKHQDKIIRKEADNL